MLRLKNMLLIDANYILRYLLNDNEQQAEEARKIIETENVEILIEVLAEVMYVLEGVYEIERNKACEGIIKLINYNNVSIKNEKVVKSALKIYSNKKIDFIDTILCAYNHEENRIVKTFDKKLNKLLN